MTTTEYARHRSLTEGSINTAIRGRKINRIQKGKYKGKIDRDAADKLWEKNTVRVNKTNKSTPEALALTAAKAKREIAVAEREELRTKKMRGELITRSTVLSTVQAISRQNRDMWLNWPKRIATEMAEELGVDSGLLYDFLSGAVKKHLETMATLDMEDAARHE